MGRRTHYEVLDLDPSATQEQIRSAYRLLSRMFHPDRFNCQTQRTEWEKANAMLRELNAAYSILRDPAERRGYDEQLRANPTRPPQPKTSRRPSEDADGDEESQPDQPRTRDTPDLNSVFLRFRSLPQEVQKRLVDLGNLRHSKPFFAVQRQSFSRYVVAFFAGLAGLIWCGNAVVSPKWTTGETLFFGALSVGSLLSLWGTVGSVLLWLRCDIRPGVFVTRLHLLRFGFDEVYVRWLWDMIDFKATHNYNNGRYTGTTFKLVFPDGSESISVSAECRAKELLSFLQGAEAVMKDALPAEDILSGASRAHVGLRTRWPKTMLGGITLCAAFLLSFAHIVWLMGRNDFYDDKLNFDSAARINTATALRGYVASRPSGRYVASAAQRLEILYNRAQDRYRAILSEGFDQNAASAVQSLLFSAHWSGSPKIPVFFSSENRIPSAIEATLARRYQLLRVLPINDAFSGERMSARQTRILQAIQRALATVFPEDILSLQAVPNEKSALLLVHYIVDASDTLFYRTSEENLPEKERPYYPGIRFRWLCTIKFGHKEDMPRAEAALAAQGFKPALPQPSDEDLRRSIEVPRDGEYGFELESKPANKFSDPGTGVYESMAASAFLEFQKELILRVGLAGQNR